jgi:hypothetical protein
MATFNADRLRHKRLAVALKASTVLTAGIATVLIGWKSSGGTPPILCNIALILGVAVTVMSAYEAFFDPRILWIRETVVSAQLKDLRRDLGYSVATCGTNEPDRRILEEFKNRLDRILAESLKAWLHLRGQGDEGPELLTKCSPPSSR